MFHKKYCLLEVKAQPSSASLKLYTWFGVKNLYLPTPQGKLGKSSKSYEWATEQKLETTTLCSAGCNTTAHAVYFQAPPNMRSCSLLCPSLWHKNVKGVCACVCVYIYMCTHTHTNIYTPPNKFFSALIWAEMSLLYFQLPAQWVCFGCSVRWRGWWHCSKLCHRFWVALAGGSMLLSLEIVTEVFLPGAATVGNLTCFASSLGLI